MFISYQNGCSSVSRICSNTIHLHKLAINERGQLNNEIQAKAPIQKSKEKVTAWLKSLPKEFDDSRSLPVTQRSIDTNKAPSLKIHHYRQNAIVGLEESRPSPQHFRQNATVGLQSIEKNTTQSSSSPVTAATPTRAPDSFDKTTDNDNDLREIFV